MRGGPCTDAGGQCTKGYYAAALAAGRVALEASSHLSLSGEDDENPAFNSICSSLEKYLGAQIYEVKA